MAVKIEIKGNKESNEFKDALVLKDIFETEFRSGEVNGEILILCNATLFGQSVKDIDLIAIGKFDRYSKRLKSKSKSFDGAHDQEMRTIFINDFCFVFETKRHRATDIPFRWTYTVSKGIITNGQMSLRKAKIRSIPLLVSLKIESTFHHIYVTSFG